MCIYLKIQYICRSVPPVFLKEEGQVFLRQNWQKALNHEYCFSFLKFEKWVFYNQQFGQHLFLLVNYNHQSSCKVSTEMLGFWLDQPKMICFLKFNCSNCFSWLNKLLQIIFKSV